MTHAAAARPPLVVGADIGGTSTRIAVVDADGRTVGSATGPGGNLRSSSGDVAQTLAATLAAALGTLPRDAVVSGYLGVAGAGPAMHRAVDALCRQVWHDAGLGGTLRVGTDLETAYASAARSPHGALLLAGTGAVAAVLHDGAVTSRSDGLGWLLGDVGSAVWFGLRALQAVAADLDGRGPATALTDAVLDHLTISPVDAPAHGAGPSAPPRDVRQDLVAAVYPLPVADHGRLAPLVSAAATAGDTVARDLVTTGADGLLASLRAARGPAPEPCEVVLAGALLTTPGPLADAVTAALAADPTVTATHPARSPLAGAVQLARG